MSVGQVIFLMRYRHITGRLKVYFTSTT